jgi:hypothetical protein
VATEKRKTVLIVLERADFIGLAESPGTLQRGLEQACSHAGLTDGSQRFRPKSCRRTFAISDVMSRAVQTLPLELSFAENVEKFQGGQPSQSQPVQLKGYCSLRELFIALGRGLRLDTSVRDFMRQAPIFILHIRP